MKNSTRDRSLFLIPTIFVFVLFAALLLTALDLPVLAEEMHVFDNECDAHCNICGYERPTPDHVYNNPCDVDCDVCGYYRTIEHLFSHDFDDTCDICGITRYLPYDASGSTGDCYWYVVATDLVITGNGAMGDYLYDSTPWGGTITSVVIEDGVTSIGNAAFEFCSSLQSVTIGNGVTTIGNSAFAFCENLYSVTFGDNVTHIADDAFSHCGFLPEIVLPDSVEVIGSQAFSSCENLTSVTLGSKISFICTAAFDYCLNLRDVWFRGTANECLVQISEFNEALYNATWHYEELLGDLDGDEEVTEADAIYLLYATLFGESIFPVNQPCDFDRSGTVDSNDAIYLLYHTLFKERFPL